MMKLFKKNRKKENQYELEVQYLKACLYEKETEINNLERRLKRNDDVINKIKKLPTAKKRELGIL